MPNAGRVDILIFIRLSCFILNTAKVYKLIDKMVQDNKKLILLTSNILRESKTGFVIIPHYIPHTAPMEETKNLIIKKILSFFYIKISNQSVIISIEYKSFRKVYRF